MRDKVTKKIQYIGSLPERIKILGELKAKTLAKMNRIQTKVLPLQKQLLLPGSDIASLTPTIEQHDIKHKEAEILIEEINLEIIKTQKAIEIRRSYGEKLKRKKETGWAR